MSAPAIRIVLLEDSAADAELVMRELGKLAVAHTVRRVATRQEFEQALCEDVPDLIVSDHNLPQFTGRAALELARELAPDVPFVLVTGSLDDETAVDYMKAGAADYVLKERLARLPSAMLRALEQTKQRRALKEYDSLVRQIIDANPNLIFVKDWDGRFVLVNQALADVYGTTVPEILGKTDADFNPNRHEVEHFLRDDREVMTSGRPKFIPEEPVTNPTTRKTRWFQTIKVPLLLPGDARPKLLGVATDITERKELEHQLLQAQKMEAIGRLAGGIAHDFNNVLTAIIGYADLVRLDLGESHAAREDLDEIGRAAERAASLTRQLLAFSRRQVLEPRIVDVNTLMANLDNMLRRLIGEDIELRTVLSPEAGLVRADPGQLEQVVVNLAVNARDAMPNGGKLTIETASLELDAEYAARHVAVTPGRYVMLAVSDTGIGMDEATKARVFEPFFTTKELGKGTGLGLSTVYGIVKQSGGNVWVYSEPGRGATFKVYLPRVEAGEVVEAEAPPVRDTRGTETILVVEDAEAVRTLARRVLVGQGYNVLEARSAAEAEAVAAAHRGPLHLLLTDVVLPERGGRDLALRLLERRPDLKVLYMSGYTDDSIVHHGVLESGVAYLQKPFTPESLARKLREVLDSQS